jgi:hypothetical protein
MSASLRTRATLAALIAVIVTTGFVPSAHDVTGKWTFKVVTPNGTGTPTVTFKQAGDKLTGTYESNALGSRTLEGSVRGDSLSFILSMPQAGEGVVLTYAAHIVTADSLKGAVDFAGQGGAEFTAVRQK